MKKFENEIVLFGFGAVGQSVLSLLEKEISFDKNKFTIIDKEPEPFDTGYRYVQAELKSEEQEKYFSKYISQGGLLLDFTSETDCLETIKWCYEKKIMYLNTGNNEWLDKGWKNAYQNYIENKIFFEKCLPNSATIITEHGANPGSVSYFAKKALFDIAHELIKSEDTDLDKRKLASLLEEKKWGELAEYIELRTIQSSDCDTQKIESNLVLKDVFYSTWSPLTFYNETTCEAEARIGTGENIKDVKYVGKYNPKEGAIEFQVRGNECFCKGWTPAGQYLGMVIGHEECFSISDCLSVYNEDGSVRYRPTSYFTYKASDVAMKSIKDAVYNDYKLPQKIELIKGGIVEGTEYVGVLLMGNKFKSRWVGNCLTLERIEKNFPGQMATILQVSITSVAGISYIINNRNSGVNSPDDLPYEEILPIIEKYAGESISVTTDFSVKHDISKDFILGSIDDLI